MNVKLNIEVEREAYEMKQEKHVFSVYTYKQTCSFKDAQICNEVDNLVGPNH